MVKMKSVFQLFGLAGLILMTCPAFTGQEITHSELVEILGVHSWRVPTPKIDNRQWTITVVESLPPKFDRALNPNFFDDKKKALIVLRDLKESTYEYSLKQFDGMSQGSFKIDLCSQKKDDEDCEESNTIEWYNPPKPFDNGTKLLIAEVNQMTERKYKRLVILELAIIHP